MFTRDGLAGISLPEWVRFSRTFVIGEAIMYLEVGSITG